MTAASFAPPTHIRPSELFKYETPKRDQAQDFIDDDFLEEAKTYGGENFGSVVAPT